MANRFWVGGTSTWDATAGTKWATTDGGVGGAAVPTAADDVFFTALSGVVTVTTVGTTNCLAHNIDCTGFTGTLVHDTSTTITVSGSLKLVAGMTYTRNSSALWTFNATATGQTVNFASKNNIGTVNFNGIGGGWQFTAGFTASTTAIFTLTNGALDWGGQTVSLGGFSSNNSNTRSVTIGTSLITLTGANAVWDITTSTNMTQTAAVGSTVTSTGANATIRGAGPNDPNVQFYNVSMTGSGTPGFFYCKVNNNFTRTGTAVKTDGISFTEVTVVGRMTLTGNSAINRLIVGTAHGPTAGNPTPATLTAATVTLTNVDFADTTAAGAAIPWTGTSLGDTGGNSNITFTTPATQTWSGNTTGSWSNAANWTSRVPLPQDNVAITGLTSGVITSDMPRLGGSIDFTGSTGGTLTFSAVGTSYGSLNLGSGLTITTNGTAALTLAGRSSYTITSNGVSFPGGANGVTITAPTGTYTLADAAIWAGNFSVTNGIFNTNNFNMTCNFVASTGALTRAITLGTSTLTVIRTSAGTVFQTVATGLTLSAASSTLIVSQASANARTIDAGGLTLGNIKVAAGTGGFTLNSVICNDLDFTGYSGALAGGTATTVNGSMTLGTGMTVTDSAFAFTFGATSGTKTITSNSVQFNHPIIFDGVGGSFQLADNIALGNRGITVTNGSFNSNAKSLNMGSFNSNNSNTRTVTLDGSTITLTGTGTISNLSTITGLTLSTTGTIWVVGDSSATGKTINWASGTWGTLKSLVNTGVLTLSGPNPSVRVYSDFMMAGGQTLTFGTSSNNSTTITGTPTFSTGPGNVLTINTTGAGSAHPINNANSILSFDYLSIKDSIAGGGAQWFAGANSANVSGNTGWNFTTPAAAAGNFFMFM